MSRTISIRMLGVRVADRVRIFLGVRNFLVSGLSVRNIYGVRDLFFGWSIFFWVYGIFWVWLGRVSRVRDRVEKSLKDEGYVCMHTYTHLKKGLYLEVD